MSAPDTNIEKQEKNHRPSLMGMKGAVLICALIILGVVGFNMINAADSTAIMGEGVSTDVYAPGTNSTATPTATE